MKKRVIIMGAAGRDFHDFLVYFKKNKDYEVVCFTADQIPGISKRKFPSVLSGRRYPKGIPIYHESKLSELIKKHKIDEVVFSYSDISHEDIMHKASLVLAAGASFRLLSYHQTSLKSKKPVVSVCAVRTGCGKSQVCRKLSLLLKNSGKRVVVVRHPMPYGDLSKQIVQRFATYADLKKHNCTIEEREEYEPHIENGIVVYAGVDYEKILRRAEKEADVIIWDGGNNDVPFFVSDLRFVVLDPHRAGHELYYHPGEENFRLADVFIINKMDSAEKSQIQLLLDHVKSLEKERGKKIPVIKADSRLLVENPKLLRGKRALVIEDGPTLTHGQMTYGAGAVAVKRLKGRLVDPRKYAKGSIKNVYKKFPKLKTVLPAMGYGSKQMKELENTINSVPCDVVVDGTPVNIGKILKVKKPIITVDYELKEKGSLTLKSVLKKKKFIR